MNSKADNPTTPTMTAVLFICNVINQVSLNRFPAFIAEFVPSRVFMVSFRRARACRVHVNASQTVVWPVREAKIARGGNAELAVYLFVRSNVIMIIVLVERRVSGQSAHALNSS